MSYEREQRDAQKEKLQDRTHLEDKKFKDAMKLLDGSSSRITSASIDGGS